MQTTWRQFFLSPTGRFSRRQFWGATLGIYGLGAVLWAPLFLDPDAVQRDGLEPMMRAYVPVFLLGVLALALSHLFTIVKRFHDRNKPWPWCLLLFIPTIGGIWILIECGCLKGTPGPNDYGGSDRLRDIVDRF